MADNPKYAGVVRSPFLTLTPTQSTNIFTLAEIGANDAIVRAIWANSNDPVGNWIALYLTNLSNDDVEVTRVKFSGATTTNPLRYVNFLDPNRLTWLDPYEIQWHLAAGYKLKVGMVDTPVSTDKRVNVFINYGDF